ncbi:MAG: ATP-grasp domain-containing protein [Nitrososphaeria archaeon]
MSLEERLETLKEAEEYRREFERNLHPCSELDPRKPFTFISVGGGELGDLAVTAAKRQLGGSKGGVMTVAFDVYEGFPAQDAADHTRVFNMMDGDELEKSIRKFVPDPSQPHAIYLEVEKADTARVCRLGVREGYKVMSTPYGPLICMDRYLTKLMFDKLKVPRVDWRHARSQREIEEVVRDFDLPVIVKPVMTSSGHGTTIVRNRSQLENAYEHALRHARGRGDEVIVERYLHQLTATGTEITQIAVRHFDGYRKITTSVAPPVEHKRPGATYHESWLPANISDRAKQICQESARKIAEYIGGLGVFALELFVVDDVVYNNEVANRPHDTGMITRWMLNMDEGAMMLFSTLGLEITPFDLKLSRSGYGVAHVVLAPELIGESRCSVKGFDVNGIRRYITAREYDGDIWYFGKPDAYSGRRMGLAIGFDMNSEKARRIAEDIAHQAEKLIMIENALK